jgi:hypothetical protein
MSTFDDNIRFSLDNIIGIRDLHQFDADKNGTISYRSISKSSNITIHKYQLEATVRSTISQVLTLSELNNGAFIIIKCEDVFRLAQMKSFDQTISQMIVCCFEPPFPTSMFNCSKSPRLRNLTISIEQFRARLIDNPERLTNGNIRINIQQLLDIQNVCDEE